MEFKDYYATLGVDRTASQEEIKQAFRKLARIHHPDTATDKTAGDAKFKEINEAYEVLKDPAKRKKYDQLGANWQQVGTAGSARQPGSEYQWQSSGGDPSGSYQHYEFKGTGFSDFFEQFFSGDSGFHFANGRGQPHTGTSNSTPLRGNDIEGDILVTLEEAMHGTTRSISLQTHDPLTGEPNSHTFKVRIPPGATDGRRIRVPARGGQGINGGKNGDLYLRVRHAAHPDYTSRGADLYREVEITPWQAALGDEITVPSLAGTLRLKVPAGSSPDRQLRVKGKGFPKGKSGQHGDLFVILKMRVPQHLSDAQRAAWEQVRTTASDA